MSDGEDLRGLPLSMRKASLSRLLARRVDGILLSDFEQREIGPDLFRHACRMGWRDWSANTARAVTEAAGLVAGQGEEPGVSSLQPGSGSVLKRRRHGRMRRFEVPEDN